MKTARHISAILNAAYILAVFLFVFDALQIVEIKSQPLKYYTYYSFLLLSPLLFTTNYFIYKSKKKRLKTLFTPFIAILLILYISPLKIIFYASAWETIETISEKNSKAKTVELQQQDIGALGYNTRTVEVTYLSPLFMITKTTNKNTKPKAL